MMVIKPNLNIYKRLFVENEPTRDCVSFPDQDLLNSFFPKFISMDKKFNILRPGNQLGAKTVKNVVAVHEKIRKLKFIYFSDYIFQKNILHLIYNFVDLLQQAFPSVEFIWNNLSQNKNAKNFFSKTKCSSCNLNSQPKQLSPSELKQLSKSRVQSLQARLKQKQKIKIDDIHKARYDELSHISNVIQNEQKNLQVEINDENRQINHEGLHKNKVNYGRNKSKRPVS